MLKLSRARKSDFAWSVSDLSALYVEHRASLVRHADRVVRNQHHAEELVQDALIKVILAAPELESEEHALAYLKRAVQNLALDALRAQGRRPSLVLLDDVASEIDERESSADVNLENLLAAEDAAIVRDAISLLSPAERAALVMWEMEGRSAKEIAAELGIKEKSVRHTVSRARTTLRKILSERIVDEARGLTALDLLSRSYAKASEVARKSTKAALSLALLLVAALGFSSLITPSGVVSKSSNTQLPSGPTSSKGINSKEINKNPLVTKSQIASQSSTSIGLGVKTKSAKNVENAKATTLNFPGLDRSGIPSGFTITDSKGEVGGLFFSGKSALVEEAGISLSFISKTTSGAANILLTQTITQDSSGATYVSLVSYGKGGNWIPLNVQVTSADFERLISGNYLLTATIQVKSEIESSIVIPASAGGRDLPNPPIRLVTRIVLDPSKTRVIAQAVQVVEGSPR